MRLGTGKTVNFNNLCLYAEFNVKHILTSLVVYKHTEKFQGAVTWQSRIRIDILETRPRPIE